MDELVKIREISLRYDISARALKYYEDMGLIQSTKACRLRLQSLRRNRNQKIGANFDSRKTEYQN